MLCTKQTDLAIWGTWALKKNASSSLWLMAHNRCWTADRLARRGLPHPEECPLCEQEDETIHHLLSGCVFARQFWHQLLGRFRIYTLTPQVDNSDLFVWWQHAHDSISTRARGGFNTLVVLGAWTFWRTRNEIVFNGASPRLDRALLLAQEDADLWLLAGAKGHSVLVAASRTG